jgi:1-deoxy-D-xylulose 5-phosphate reductoisomerase
MIKEANSDVYENSISGFSGLFPSIEILKLNKILLLANKESLVVGGEFIKELLNSGHGRLIPIDSEHVAISKCLYKNDVKDIDHIVLTASGGQFFDYSREKLSEVSTKVALSNPNWQMGKRITLDSNTMMNKMFEIVEAHYLFDLPLDKIKVLVNKDSYVHSFVVFKDKTILCVGKPTMIDPIIYALNLAIPNNKEDHFTDLEVNTQNQYKFYKVDENRFPSLSLAKVILDNLGDAGCIINALDEEVIKNYLANKITFKEIDETIIHFARESKYRKVYDIKELKKIDFDTRLMVQDYFDKVRIK